MGEQPNVWQTPKMLTVIGNCAVHACHLHCAEYGAAGVYGPGLFREPLLYFVLDQVCVYAPRHLLWGGLLGSCKVQCVGEGDTISITYYTSYIGLLRECTLPGRTQYVHTIRRVVHGRSYP